MFDALLVVAHVGQRALDGGGGSQRRAYQVSSSTAALPALEVAVRGRGAALAGFEPVGVHGETHRAALDAPFEARLDEDLVETFLLGLGRPQARARLDHGRLVLRDRAAARELGGGAQVLD